MTLIRQKENADIIREEIRSIHGPYGTFQTSPEIPNVPCPFTHFLIFSAWSSDLNDPKGFYSGCCTLPAAMGTSEGDNNDGITIDVTNPELPAYCFVSIYGISCVDRSSIPNMTPLSATQYLRGYYPPNDMDDYDQEQSILTILRPFEFNESEESRATSVKMPLPSLVDLTFLPALNHALQSGEIDRLDPFMWLPENAPKIKETLRSRNPLSATDFALLSKFISVELVERTKSIDLSHFSLTGQQVIELLSTHEDVEVLNLSHMQHIATDVLRQLIPILPNLRRLVLLHTIPDADILSLLSESPELFYRIEAFIHLTVLRPFDKAPFSPAFSHISVIRSTTNDSQVVSLPYFTPDQLIQGLTDYFSRLTSRDGFYKLLVCMLFPDEPKIPLLAAYASVVREPGRSWSERIVPFISGNASNEREGWFLACSVLRSDEDSLYLYALRGELMNEIAEFFPR